MTGYSATAFDRWLTTEPEDGPAYWVGVAIAGYPLDTTDLTPVPVEELVAVVQRECYEIAESEWENAHGLAAGQDFEAAWQATLVSQRFETWADNLDVSRVKAPRYAAFGDAAADQLDAEQRDFIDRVVAGSPFSFTSIDGDSYTRVLVIEEVER